MGAVGLSLLLQAAEVAADTASPSNVRTFQSLVRLENPESLLRAVVLLFLGVPLVFAVGKWARRWIAAKSTPQRGMIVGKLVFYVGVAIVATMTLAELGFSLAPLLGAAGILGIALGFASQTSVSNIISGFFLMAEQPFVVDDVIQIGPTIGRVLSIDMMSVKLRTFDNRFVRIPNEQIIKTEVTTITRFPIRRVDVDVGVAYKEDIGRVREVLLDVARRHPLSLMEPEPLVLFQGYMDSSINFRFAVWTVRENFFRLRNEITEAVKMRFDEEGIEIPFPHRTLYPGSVTEPFPIRLVEGDGWGGAGGGGAAGAGGEGSTGPGGQGSTGSGGGASGDAGGGSPPGGWGPAHGGAAPRARGEDPAETGTEGLEPPSGR
ncbi:MAG: mechanosensitive ion channel family protein [Gemmatimonadetes bacterium]|nr:mechanosensitive ion channel family protein [Gemmatimonadota bacterium]